MQPDGRSLLTAPDGAHAGLLQRLQSANVHLQGVIVKTGAGEPCESVLHQLVLFGPHYDVPDV